ncbi:MAG: RecX family transcriptional regulator [Clostridia bacterium]|nr:RecX family transcriptional regulator [Clostridia bacterium]
MMNNSFIRICGMRAADGGAQLVVEIEQRKGEEVIRETVALLTARLEGLPTVGEIGEEELLHLRREAEICDAIGAGMRSLGANGCSARYLAQKLRAKGFSADVAGEAVAELAEKGYLKEEEGALREAEKGIAKLWGDRRILADLQAKGYTGGALACRGRRRALCDADAQAPYASRGRRGGAAPYALIADSLRIHTG